MNGFERAGVPSHKWREAGDSGSDALRSRELQFQLGAMDNRKNLPTFIGKLKIYSLNFPVDDGVCPGV